MNKFESIKNDKEIIELYNKIYKFEEETKGWAHHDFNHVCNVAILVENILKDLNYDDEFIEEAKIAAILHDVGCIEGKDGHPLRSYAFAKDYFKRKNIDLKYEDLVLEAIKIHSDGFNTDNIIAIVLILSDKLDIKYTRITKEGLNIVGNRQIQYIKDVLINIDNDTLNINFICDEKIDKLELEGYYFMKKVFKAIKAFSNKMNFTTNVLLNYEKWEEFYLE